MKDALLLVFAIAAGAYVTYKRFQHKFVPKEVKGFTPGRKE